MNIVTFTACSNPNLIAQECMMALIDLEIYVLADQSFRLEIEFPDEILIS